MDRFYPPRPFGMGKSQAHWLLDEGGALLVAAGRGVQRLKLGWERRDDCGSHPQLAHQLGANRFVTDLIAATLPDPALGVTVWWSPRGAAARLCGERRYRRPLPDAGFFLDAPAGAIECYLEWDRATETQATLADKVRAYWSSDRRWQEPAERVSVLFVVPSAGRLATLLRAYAEAAEREREREARSPLDHARWPVVCATAPALRGDGPLGAVWHDLGARDNERLRALTELPARSDMPAANLERSLGRRWRKERPDFWAALSPLGATPAAQGVGQPASAGTDAARAGDYPGAIASPFCGFDGLIDRDPEEEEDW